MFTCGLECFQARCTDRSEDLLNSAVVGDLFKGRCLSAWVRKSSWVSCSEQRSCGRPELPSFNLRAGPYLGQIEARKVPEVMVSVMVRWCQRSRDWDGKKITHP